MASGLSAVQFPWVKRLQMWWWVTGYRNWHIIEVRQALLTMSPGICDWIDRSSHEILSARRSSI